MILMLLLAGAQIAGRDSAADTVRMTGARNPAYAADGRLALSVRGKLWVRSNTGNRTSWRQVTSGPGWDREPAWTRDGSSLVYTSNAQGYSQLYSVALTSQGAAPVPNRLAVSSEPESEPSVSPNGDILFAKGRAGQTQIWLRTAAGAERRFTSGSNGAERWPAWSPDGRRVAYSTVREDRTRLRVRWIDGDSDRVIVQDRDAEHPAWSPSGDRIAFASRNGRAGVWITTPDAGYVNLVSTQRAAPAWSPDGRTIALAELPGADVGYNGDPDRIGDRDTQDEFGTTGRLWFVAAPSAPDAGLVASPLPSADQKARNAAAFAAFWQRMDTLYFRQSTTRHREWDALRASYASRAQAAGSDVALELVLHDMLRARPPLRDAATGRAAVSSAHPVATAAGLEMLRKGGNVVDAAVAISFALGVVEPDASGLGGYGQMLVRMRAMERPVLIEFMSRAPEEASLANGALMRRGRALDGPILVNVPGTLAGMELAWKKYGSRKVTWAETVAPAIRAAEQGFIVSEGLATTLQTEREHFLKSPAARALFFPKGEPLHAGDTLRNVELARTLRTIADSGGTAFYQGSIAKRLVADLRGQGNAMRLADMARYYAAEREPVSGTYRGYTVYSSAPPSAGGATLVSQLNFLEQQGGVRAYTEDAGSLHAMIEAWKLVPSSRGRIADPGLWPVSLDAFLSKDSATARWRCFNPQRALTTADIRGDTLPCAQPGKRVSSSATAASTESESECATGDDTAGAQFCHRTGTTAFAVADADGNIVSATQTLGTWGGNFYVTPGLGFLYNDKLESYGSDPGEYGARLPNARHGSSLAPTIVFHGDGAKRRPVLAVAAAGNSWITSAVYSVVTGVLDQHLGAQRAIELPRFLLDRQASDARSKYVIQVEDGFSPRVLRELGAMGHVFQRISLPGELRMGYAAVITVGDRDVTAGADPRRAGEAGAIDCARDTGMGCRP